MSPTSYRAAPPRVRIILCYRSQTQIPLMRHRLVAGPDLNRRPSGYEPDELPGCSTPRPMDAHYTLHAFCCKPFLHFIGLNPFFCWICPQFAFFFITILHAAFLFAAIPLSMSVCYRSAGRSYQFESVRDERTLGQIPAGRVDGGGVGGLFVRRPIGVSNIKTAVWINRWSWSISPTPKVRRSTPRTTRIS